MKGLHIWLLVAIVIGGGAFMACKSSSTKSTTTTTKPTATKSSTTQKAATPSSSSANPSSQLSDLEGKLATKVVKATYNFTTTAGSTTTQGTFTVYSKPPDSRLDYASGGTSGSIISAGGKSYVCSAGTCLQSSSLSGAALPFLGYFTNPQSLSSLIGAGSGVSHSNRTIAGQSADCFTASGSVAGQQGAGEICFSSDGVLLSLKSSSAGNGFDLEATSVEGSVADTDLTPPYPVATIPGVP